MPRRRRSTVDGTGEAALVRDGAVDQRAHVGLRERLERQQQGSRQQRPHHGEGRVLGGGADERHPAVLHGGQQRVLLGAREAVDLVDEQHGLALPHRDATLGVVDDRAHVLDACGDRAELHEAAITSDEVRERGLARAGRTPQDERSRRGVGPDEANQRRAVGEQVRLPNDLVERARTHAHGERRVGRGLGHARGGCRLRVEEVHEVSLGAAGEPAARATRAGGSGCP